MAKQNDGIFMHAARPAEVSEGKYSDQRYFGANREENTNQCLEIRTPSRISVTVLRFAYQPCAQLEIQTGSGLGARNYLHVPLDADQMQTLACALLDAAHELRTVAATSEEEVAA